MEESSPFVVKKKLFLAKIAQYEKGNSMCFFAIFATFARKYYSGRRETSIDGQTEIACLAG